MLQYYFKKLFEMNYLFVNYTNNYYVVKIFFRNWLLKRVDKEVIKLNCYLFETPLPGLEGGVDSSELLLLCGGSLGRGGSDVSVGVPAAVLSDSPLGGGRGGGSSSSLFCTWFALTSSTKTCSFWKQKHEVKHVVWSRSLHVVY